MIKLVAYDPEWPAMFEVEAGEIRRLFGSLALEVEHVGLLRFLVFRPSL
jgi:GrpB-like predicted nucleotidyltransferase (UPF0157 family)